MFQIGKVNPNPNYRNPDSESELSVSLASCDTVNLNAEPVGYMISYVTCVMVYGGSLWKVDRGCGRTKAKRNYRHATPSIQF